MRREIALSLLFCAVQASAQCNSTPQAQPSQAQPQTPAPPRVQNIDFLQGPPEPYNLWSKADNYPFPFAPGRHSEADLRDLLDMGLQSLVPQAINISGLENRPVDLSMRSQPTPDYAKKPLGAPVPPPPPPQPEKKSFLKRLLFSTKKPEQKPATPGQPTTSR